MRLIAEDPQAPGDVNLYEGDEEDTAGCYFWIPAERCKLTWYSSYKDADKRPPTPLELCEMFKLWKELNGDR